MSWKIIYSYQDMISILIVVLCLGVGLWVIYTILSLAPWFPTRTSDLERIGDLSRLQTGESFYDIGSGDGRVIFALSKRYPKCHIYGYEMSFLLYLYSSLKSKFIPSTNTSIYWRNGLTQDFSKAAVVYVFATQKTLNAKPMKNVIRDLPAGSRVLSYNFHIENWDGEVLKDKPVGKTPIYVYTKK